MDRRRGVRLALFVDYCRSLFHLLSTRVLPAAIMLALLVPALTVAQAPSADRIPGQADPLAAIRAGFAAPPADARPMMRWWWFGPAVEKTELARELRTMKAGGIGGAEIQPVYALELDEPAKNFRNLPYLSKDFLGMVSFAAQTAHDLGMRLNLTLASGWPYGGSYVPVSDAAGKLRIAVEPVQSGATSLPVPSIRNGEKLLAVFLAGGTPQKYDAEHAQTACPCRAVFAWMSRAWIRLSRGQAQRGFAKRGRRWSARRALLHLQPDRAAGETRSGRRRGVCPRPL